MTNKNKKVCMRKKSHYKQSQKDKKITWGKYLQFISHRAIFLVEKELLKSK